MAERAPQLIMRRPHLLNLPAPRVPQGYEIRHFRKGDEAGWNALMDLAFERTPGRADFTRDMAADELYRPERVRLVLDDAGAIVATASCWQGERSPRQASGGFGPEPRSLMCPPSPSFPSTISAPPTTSTSPLE